MTVMLSLDPGGTTGWALIQYWDEKIFNILQSGQIPGGLQGFIEFVDGELFQTLLELDTDLDHIVCESFTLREGVYGADLSPVYIIGALEGMYAKIKPISYQEPKIKPLCDDLRLKKLGVHTPGKPHENDAIRHGIIYLRNNKNMPTLEAGWKE